jgi:hypothetical protein
MSRGQIVAPHCLFNRIVLLGNGHFPANFKNPHCFTLSLRKVKFLKRFQQFTTTMIALVEKLQLYGPSSVTVVSLLVTRHCKVRKFEPHLVGFSIPDVFVVGYGLDYNESFRDLQPIAVINAQGVEKYAN